MKIKVSKFLILSCFSGWIDLKPKSPKVQKYKLKIWKKANREKKFVQE